MTLQVIRVPDIGEGVAEVELVAWHVAPGDVVAEDQVLCEVMTDKAAVEIPSSAAGRVLALGGEIGQMMAVGSELIRIETDAAAPAPADVAPEAPRPPTAQPGSAATSAPGPAPAAPQAPAPIAVPEPPPAPGAAVTRPIASPAVRARAWEMGIELARVTGTGPAGRIVHADLEAAAARGDSRPVARQTAATDVTHTVKVLGLRRRIAQKMQESKRHIPHYTYVEEVDVTEMVALRDALNARHGAVRGVLSPLAFVVRAVVRAVAGHPQVNARFDDESGVLTLHDAVHLGVATQTEAGLMVPVLRQAQTLDLWTCAAEMARLAEIARAGKAARDQLSGSTITVTSLGKLGGIASTPVINHPEVAIVGVNRIAARPVVRGGAVEVRQMMNLSSSFDHRVVDGAVAAAFIQTVRGLLEHPATLFVD